MTDTLESSTSENSLLKQCLLVDDEEMVRQVAVRQLARLQWRASEFASGQDAIDAFKLGPQAYQLALVDLNMPGISGMAVYLAIRALRADLPVILISGDTSTVNHAEVELDPKVTVLNKPYRREELQQTINVVI